MTKNQSAFEKLKQKVERWTKSAEKQGIKIDYNLPEKPARITKKFLNEIKKEIPKQRWKFYEKYGTQEATGQQYKRPEKEVEKSKEIARKGWETRRRKQSDYSIEDNDDYGIVDNDDYTIGDNDDYGTDNDDYEDLDSIEDIPLFQQAENAIHDLIERLQSVPTDNIEYIEVLSTDLYDWLENDANEENIPKFIENYESNLPLIESAISNIAEFYKQFDIVTASNEFLNYLFEGVENHIDFGEIYRIATDYLKEVKAYNKLHGAKHYYAD